jgi:hypothetical protein
MKKLSRKTMTGLIAALTVAAVAAPVAQAGFEARSERSQVVRPSASFYSSPAYHALMVRSAAMNTWFREHPSTSAAVRHADDRAGIRGPGIAQTPQVVSTSGDGFDWGDASLGAGVALAGSIVLLGAIALTRRHRSEPAAA